MKIRKALLSIFICAPIIIGTAIAQTPGTPQNAPSPGVQQAHPNLQIHTQKRELKHERNGRRHEMNRHHRNKMPRRPNRPMEHK